MNQYSNHHHSEPTSLKSAVKHYEKNLDQLEIYLDLANQELDDTETQHSSDKLLDLLLSVMYSRDEVEHLLNEDRLHDSQAIAKIIQCDKKLEGLRTSIHASLEQHDIQGEDIVASLKKGDYSWWSLIIEKPKRENRIINFLSYLQPFWDFITLIGCFLLAYFLIRNLSFLRGIGLDLSQLLSASGTGAILIAILGFLTSRGRTEFQNILNAFGIPKRLTSFSRSFVIILLTAFIFLGLPYIINYQYSKSISNGTKNINEKRFISAKRNFEQALLFKPDDAEALYGIGLSFEGIGDLDKAEENFQKASFQIDENQNYENALSRIIILNGFQTDSWLSTSERTREAKQIIDDNVSVLSKGIGDYLSIYKPEKQYASQLLDKSRACVLRANRVDENVCEDNEEIYSRIVDYHPDLKAKSKLKAFEESDKRLRDLLGNQIDAVTLLGFYFWSKVDFNRFDRYNNRVVSFDDIAEIDQSIKNDSEEGEYPLALFSLLNNGEEAKNILAAEKKYRYAARLESLLSTCKPYESSSNSLEDSDIIYQTCKEPTDENIDKDTSFYGTKRGMIQGRASCFHRLSQLIKYGLIYTDAENLSSLVNRADSSFNEVIEELDNRVGAMCYSQSGHPISQLKKYEDRIAYDLRRIRGFPKNP